MRSFSLVGAHGCSMQRTWEPDRVAPWAGCKSDGNRTYLMARPQDMWLHLRHRLQLVGHVPG